MTKEENRGKRGEGKVAFWAHKASIKKMLDDKYTVTATHLAHKKDVNIKYQQFRRYVNELIRSDSTKEKTPERNEAKKEDVAAKIKSDPNYVANTLKSDPNRKKEDLT